jgi:hypothetical protein
VGGKILRGGKHAEHRNKKSPSGKAVEALLRKALVHVNVDALALPVIPVVVMPAATSPVPVFIVAVPMLVSDLDGGIGRSFDAGALAWERTGALWGSKQQRGGDTNGSECFVHLKNSFLDSSQFDNPSRLRWFRYSRGQRTAGLPST